MIYHVIREQLKKHEGEKKNDRGRHLPYKDTVGKWTIGWGRNLSDRGISEDEALFLLDNDIRDAVEIAQALFKNFDSLNHVRQHVLIDMAFNLGHPRLSKFRLMRAAVKADDFSEAANQMVNSRWYLQTGTRAARLERMMRAGET